MAEEKKRQMTMKDVFKATFDNPDGQTMLYWILNECGYFATTPGSVDPSLIAFANRLLQEGGVTNPARAGRYIANLMVTASVPVEERSDDEDIMEE